MKIRLLLSFLLFANLAQAQLISYPEEKIMGFRGLDTTATAPLVADSRAVDLLNVKLSTALNLQKRYGFDTVNDTTLDQIDTDNPVIQGIFDSEYSNGNSWTLVFAGARLLYDNAGTWTTVNGGVNIGTAGQNNQWHCVMAFDSAVCTNDVDLPIKISSDPTASILDVSDLSDALTKTKVFAFFRNYFIHMNTVEGGTERPTRFRWSDVGTIETYQNDNFIDISTFAGDEIIGAAELYGDIYVFLKKSIWKVSLVGGDDVFQIKKVIDNIGAIARDSIQLITLPDNRTAVIFLDEKKRVLMFNGVSVTNIGSIIQPTLDNLNASRLQYAVSTFDGKDYYLSASTSGSNSNDIVFDFQTEIFEWTKHDQIDANAFAQVKENTSVIKTYFGNYDSFVYWMDNPDLINDVDGATGIVDSMGTLNTSTITGATVIVDAGLNSGSYTGAIVRVTSGTGVGQEAVVVTSDSTSLTVATAFGTQLDATSVYSVGDINAYYYGKHYELGSASREKNAFLGMLMWAKEQSNSEVDVSYAIDFGSVLGSETKDLSPSTSSLWDSALWDEGTWGTTGDKIYTVKFSGIGNHIQPRWAQNDIDKTFDVYGFNIIATIGDIKQP